MFEFCSDVILASSIEFEQRTQHFDNRVLNNNMSIMQQNSLNPSRQSSAIRAEMQDTRRLYCGIYYCTHFNDVRFRFL